MDALPWVSGAPASLSLSLPWVSGAPPSLFVSTLGEVGGEHA